MRSPPRWHRYFRFFGANVAADVEDELAFHVEMRIRDYESHGYSRADAELAARGRLGDLRRVESQLVHHDTQRAQRVTRREYMDRLGQDLRLALRGFRRTPGFFVTAVTILALGIGMSVAMFTVFRTVLVRRLPVVDQDRIAVMWTYREPTVEATAGSKPLSAVRRDSRTMRDVAAVAHWAAAPSPFLDGERVIALSRGMATGNFFDVLGARPALGRLFHSSDDDVGDFQTSGDNMSKVLVLSYKAWQTRFGGDSSIIGHHLVEPYRRWTYTIIGVAPPGLSYPDGAEYWMPMWGGWNGYVSSIAVARLAPGATLNAARDEYFAIENQQVPEAEFRGANVKTFTETVLGDVTPILALLSGAVALLLLIACLNVGNLLLLRASTRAREVAVRRALGAGYGDIVRQLLVEAVLLATVGGIVGFALAAALLRALVAYAPPHLPRLDDVRLSGAPVLAAIGISSLTVLLFGVLPAMLAARANLASPLRLDSRSGNETRRRRTMRQALVASQVALAMIMLGGAGLLARSLARLQNQDAGYVSDHLAYLQYSWNAKKYDSTAKSIALSDRILRRLQSIPGVTAAATTALPPLVGLNVWQARFDKLEQSAQDAAKNPLIPFELVGADFFKALGIPVVRGRPFADSDRENSAFVVVVSESVARRYWPGEDPIGKQLRLNDSANDFGGTRPRTVVGVVPDTHLRTVRESAPTIYVPTHQGYWQGTFAIRTTVPMASLMSALRAAGHDADPQTDLWQAQAMDQFLDEPLAQPRLGTLLMSSFGLVALTLAAIGLYGVMASLVRDQMREIGIRIALGATASHVRREVLGRASLVTLIGVLVGLAGALATSRLLTRLLFHVSPTDPVALVGASAILLAAGALAAYLPARRATRIDPVQALRAD